MNAPISPDVLICGAGAAGLAMAIELARRGITFRLIEKSDHPFTGSRGKGIQPRTQEIFEDLGILDKIVAQGGTYPPDMRYHEDGSVTRGDVMDHHEPEPAEPFPLALMVPQFRTEQVMRERLAELGHNPEFGCELISFEQDSNGVTAHLAGKSGNETIRVRWLIGADGGRSVVRRALNIEFPGKTLGVRAIVADVALSGLPRNAWHRFNDGNAVKHIMICPLPRTNLYQIQAPIPCEGEVDLSAVGLTAMVAERTGRHDILIHSVAWSSAYTMNARLAERYRINRVLLIGDAAHIHPPTGGQGLNTSIQDAYNLGWKLAAVIDGAPAALLDTYEQERRPVAAEMLGLSAKLLDEAKRGEIHRGREVKQLDIRYPQSALNLKAKHPDGRLPAGYRAPDASVLGAAGQRTRIFSLLEGTHWTLIGYQVGAYPISPRKGLRVHTFGENGDLADDLGHFSRAYGVQPGDWVLIRPDGHVATVRREQDLAEIEDHLSRLGICEVMGSAAHQRDVP